MSKRMAVNFLGGFMLKASEREKLQDCLLLIQSARNILSTLPLGLIPDLSDLQKCFGDADRSLTRLLRA
jgi:hypothetical protein